MTRGAPAHRSLIADEDGAVYLEFLIAFVPIWTFSLCVLQLALIARADLLVRHAAEAAARSASVVLPDDPNEYGGEPTMSVARNRFTIGDLGSLLNRVVPMRRVPSSGGVAAAFSDRVLGNLGRSRLNTVRLAVHVPLMPLAPFDVGTDRQPSLRKAIGGKRSLLSSVYYQPFAVAVTFPGAENDIVIGPEVTVRVSYAYQCTVPLARRVLCGRFGELEGSEDWSAAFLPMVQRLVGGRFRRLEHEATALLHGAPYEYRPRGS